MYIHVKKQGLTALKKPANLAPGGESPGAWVQEEFWKDGGSTQPFAGHDQYELTWLTYFWWKNSG